MLARHRYSEWDWDYDEQRYYHRFCDAYAEDHKCLMCQTPTPDSFTWNDVLEFIREEGFDKDEYFSLSPVDRGYLDRQVWDGGIDIWCIPVYWMVGGSEGYYVHVDRLIIDEGNGNRSQLMLLGKFWDKERAKEAVVAISEFINSK